MSDWKSQLNLFCQSKWSQPAKYANKNVGLQHQPIWKSSVTLPDQRTFRVERFAGLVAAAEQEVARVALDALEAAGELAVKRTIAKQTSSSSSSSSSSSPSASPTAVRVAAVSTIAQPTIVPFNVEAESANTTNHHLVLAKALDVFRSSLVRPLQSELVQLLGNNGWLATLKTDKSLSEMVRGRIDASMMLWDTMAVCLVALWFLKQTGRLEKLKTLRLILDRVRHRVAHINATASKQLIDWPNCKLLVTNAVAFLEWWNVSFTNKVDRSFVRQLNDIGAAGSSSLIEPPLIPRSEISIGNSLASGAQATVYSAMFRDEPVAVKQFSSTLSTKIEHNIRKELQTMVKQIGAFSNLSNCIT
jgi:hypothetical protein